MAWTQADIDTLEQAIATGALSVRAPDGRQVTYQSTDAMLKTLALMKRDVQGSTTGAVRLVEVHKGV